MILWCVLNKNAGFTFWEMLSFSFFPFLLLLIYQIKSFIFISLQRTSMPRVVFFYRIDCFAFKFALLTQAKPEVNLQPRPADPWCDLATPLQLSTSLLTFRSKTGIPGDELQIPKHVTAQWNFVLPLSLTGVLFSAPSNTIIIVPYLLRQLCCLSFTATARWYALFKKLLLWMFIPLQQFFSMFIVYNRTVCWSVLFTKAVLNLLYAETLPATAYNNSCFTFAR